MLGLLCWILCVGIICGVSYDHRNSNTVICVSKSGEIGNISLPACWWSVVYRKFWYEFVYSYVGYCA